MVQSNDGGANVTMNGGVTWSSQMNQPTAEIYQIETDDQFPYRLYGAQQDTGWPIILPSRPPFSHSYDDALMMQVPGPGCETGPVKPKPGAPHIVFGVCKGEFYRMNLETGQEQSYWVYPQNRYGQAASDIRYRMQRITPFEISPHDPNVIYFGSQFLHRTADGGQTWDTISPDLTAHPAGTQGISGEPITRDITGEEIYSTIYAIEESRLEKGVIWVGTNDGLVQITRDHGKTWTNVTPKGMPPMGRVQSIDDSPHRKGSALVSYYRTLLGEFKPYVYRTDDYGATWTLLTDGKNGIPDNHPTRVAREDPDREGLIYAGTEFGMFISLNGGKTWQSFQLNLPATPVTDLKIFRGDLVLSTMGRGVWILDNVSAVHQLANVDVSATAALLAPPPAYRLRYEVMTGPADPQFIEPGAILDYALKADAPENLRLEVMDSTGAVIRSFESGPAQAAETTQGMRAPETRLEGPPRLSSKAGAHRFIWDLRHNGVPGFRGLQGPMVAPGDYRVRLSLGSFSEERPLKVLSDPRLARDGVTDAMIGEQTKLLLDIREKITDTRGLLQKLTEARTQDPERYDSFGAGATERSRCGDGQDPDGGGGLSSADADRPVRGGFRACSARPTRSRARCLRTIQRSGEGIGGGKDRGGQGNAWSPCRSERNDEVPHFRAIGPQGVELCLGAMTFGEDWGFGASKEESRKQFDVFVAAGGNFIDTANVYTKGTSERFVGEFVKSDRDKFVVATKYSIRDPLRRHQRLGELAQESGPVGRGLLAAARPRPDRPLLGPCGGPPHARRRDDARSGRRGPGREGHLCRGLGHSRLAGGSRQYAGRASRLESFRRASDRVQPDRTNTRT